MKILFTVCLLASTAWAQFIIQGSPQLQTLPGAGVNLALSTAVQNTLYIQYLPNQKPLTNLLVRIHNLS